MLVGYGSNKQAYKNETIIPHMCFYTDTKDKMKWQQTVRKQVSTLNLIQQRLTEKLRNLESYNKLDNTLKEEKMSIMKCVANVFTATEDAVVVDKFASRMGFSDSFATQLTMQNHRVKVIAEAKRLQDEEDKRLQDKER
jgi:hypothetical protein